MDIERLHEGFTKFHLNRDGSQPWPIRPVLHLFTEPDQGDPHDHPWDYRTFVLYGSYVEESYGRYPTGARYVMQRTMKAGTCATFRASHVHKIIALPQGLCMTLVLSGRMDEHNNFEPSGEVLQEQRFYRFDGARPVASRPWHSPHWTVLGE